MSWKLQMWSHCLNVMIQNYLIIKDECLCYALCQRSLRKLCTIGCEAFLINTKLFSSYQFGFRKPHSTYMALMTLMDNLINSLDNLEYVIGIFLDFSKSFDTVDHGILLQRLSSYGVRGEALTWFQSYLINWYQFVIYNGVSSEKKEVKCGGLKDQYWDPCYS